MFFYPRNYRMLEKKFSEECGSAGMAVKIPGYTPGEEQMLLFR